MKKSVFVSFDYENDRHYKFLLQAWDANDQFDFVFEDASSEEITSDNIDRIKAALTAKIRAADYTLVIIGQEANKLHPDHQLIGFRNWINFEVSRSVDSNNRMVAVKLRQDFDSPDELFNVNASWAYSFSEETIITAINNA